MFLHVHARALAKLDGLRGLAIQRHARGIGARLRIGGGRDFTDAARQAFARRTPQLHQHRLADAHLTDARLGERDGDFAPGIAGQGIDGLSCGDGLPGFGQARRDHAVARREQARVRGLVAHQLVLRARGAVGGLLRIERRLADQFLRDQFAIAFEVAAEPRHLRLRGGDLQAGIAGIEFRQQRAAAHAIAGIDQALDQTAADAERERAFLAGADFAGIGTERGVRAARRLHHQYRASGFHRRFGFAAGGKRDRQYRHQHRNLRPVPHFAPSSRWSKLMN